MPHLYILECADSTFYVGSTKNLVKRLWENENGVGANFTSKRLPVKLVYCEEHGSPADAFEWEKQIQGWSHAKKATQHLDRKLTLMTLDEFIGLASNAWLSGHWDLLKWATYLPSDCPQNPGNFSLLKKRN